MNNDQKLIAEAYDKINEGIVIPVPPPQATEALLALAGGNKLLALVYVLLAYVGIPSLSLALLTYDKYDVKRFLAKIWNGLRGRLTLDPDDVFKAADKVKQILKGSEKGKVTRLVNNMKFYIERGKMSEAQRVADELKVIFSNTDKEL